MNCLISPVKANRLYWLARYVERVFLSLDTVRKYIDSDIDGSAESYKEYCKLLSIDDKYADAKDFRKKYLYDKDNPSSVFRMLVNAFDNGIELREDITTESLSYIHLAMEVIEKCAAKNAKISDLYSVSDYMLSFWGCIDENVVALPKVNILRLGRRVEGLDIHIRLRTNWDFVNEILRGGILTNVNMLPSIADKKIALRLKELIESHSGENHGEDSVEILDCISRVFTARL